MYLAAQRMSVGHRYILLSGPPGCGSVSGKVLFFNKSLYQLKQRGRAWYQLSSLTLVERGFEQCLVDICLFRLVVAGYVAVMIISHADDVKIAATEVATGVVFSAPGAPNKYIFH